MAAMVAMERHVWLNLSGIKKKDRAFLLDAPISPSVLFGDASVWSVTGFRRRKSSLRHLRSTSLAAINLRRLLRVGSPSRHQAPHTGRYKKRVLLLEPLCRDLGNRGNALTQSPLSQRSIWRPSFRWERLRESSCRASEHCPPWDGAIKVVSTSEPSGNKFCDPAIQYASGHINFQRTHAASVRPKGLRLGSKRVHTQKIVLNLFLPEFCFRGQ